MINIPQKSMGYWQVVSTATALWWTTLARILPLAVLSAFCNGLPLVFSTYTTFQGMGAVSQRPFLLTATIVLKLLNLIPYAGIYAWLFHEMHGTPINCGQALIIGTRKFLWLLLLIIILLLLILCVDVIIGSPFYFLHRYLMAAAGIIIAVNFYLFVSLLFAAPLIIVQNLSAVKALIESYHLVKNHWWLTTNIFITVLAITMAISFAIMLYASNTFQTISTLVTLIVFPSFFGSFILVQLHNLQMRKSQQ